jgi:4-hydroxy-2-oxoheptanedioate aldolase
MSDCVNPIKSSRRFVGFQLGAAICVVVALWTIAAPGVGAQPRFRANRLIEALEAGQPAMTGDTWTFIDREHRPYSIDEIQTTLNKLFANKNEKGQVTLAPIVRIPMEGDQESGWAIKQVLERGAMGIVIPHVETRKDILRIISGMRYPNQKGAKYLDPPGRRGCGCGGGSGWGLKAPGDYMRVADVWPLNPEGELFFMPMIETELAVKNIAEILDTPGLGGPLIGPSDLSMSMGYGPRNPAARAPQVEEAIMTVAKACSAKKRYCGMVSWNEAETKEYLQAGFKFIFTTYRPNSNF